MRRWMSLALCACWVWPAQADTLRVGSRVLVTGDSAARVIELLGKPLHRAGGAGVEDARVQGSKRRGKTGGKRASSGKASGGGERWQYRLGGRTVTVVLVKGKVARIE